MELPGVEDDAPSTPSASSLPVDALDVVLHVAHLRRCPSYRTCTGLRVENTLVTPLV